MKHSAVTMVRIYLNEADGHLKALLKRLHDWEKVKGVTVFRGIESFGRPRVVHTSALVETSLDLPIVVEFFDEPRKIESILDHLSGMIDSGHIISWQASLIENDDQKS